MAILTVQSFDESGTALTMSAASSGGDQFSNTGKQMVVIHNTDASSKTVTVVAQNTEYTKPDIGVVTKSSQQLSVPASGIGIIGPFPINPYNDSNRNVQITYSAVTGVNVAVVAG